MRFQLSVLNWLSPKAGRYVGVLGLGISMLVGCSSTGSKGKSLVSGLPSPRATLASTESPKAATGSSGGLFGKKLAKADPNAKVIDELLAQARAYEARSKEEKAAKTYEQILQLNPDHVVALHRLGVIADSHGNTEEAEQLLTRAIKQQPKNAELCSDLGYCYFLQQRFTEAEALARQAIQHNGKNPLYHNNLGLILGHQDRYDEAFDEFAKAGSKADAFYNMAFVFAMQDHVDEAKECFREVLAVKPDHKGAREALANFEQSDRGDVPGEERAIARKAGDRREWVPYIEPGATEEASQVASASGQGRDTGSVKPASAEFALPKTTEVSRFTRQLHNRGANLMNHHMASQRGDARANPSGPAPKGNLMPVPAK